MGAPRIHVFYLMWTLIRITVNSNPAWYFSVIQWCAVRCGHTKTTEFKEMYKVLKHPYSYHTRIIVYIQRAHYLMFDNTLKQF